MNAVKPLIRKERSKGMNTRIHSPSRRRFLRTLVAGAGGYAMGSLAIHPEETIGQSIPRYLGGVSMESRWEAAASALVNWQITFLKMLLDKDGREKLFQYTKEQSPALAASNKRLADHLGFTGNDAQSAASIIPAMLTILYGPRQKYELVEATVERARVTCLECAFWNNVQATHIVEDLCYVNCQYYWDGFTNAINPRLISTLVKSRPLYDSVCEWVIDLKA